MDERNVTKIPVRHELPRLSKVGVYCRVSTNQPEQLRSMSAQASHKNSSAQQRMDTD